LHDARASLQKENAEICLADATINLASSLIPKLEKQNYVNNWTCIFPQYNANMERKKERRKGLFKKLIFTSCSDAKEIV
jgi:alanyl-tRNA synthetase